MHHDSEVPILVRVKQFGAFLVLLCFCLWEEVCESFRTLKQSLVTVFEAMIPLLATQRQRRERKREKMKRVMEQKRQRKAAATGEGEGGGGGEEGGNKTSSSAEDSYSSTPSAAASPPSLSFSPIASHADELRAFDKEVKEQQPQQQQQRGGQKGPSSGSTTPVTLQKKSFVTHRLFSRGGLLSRREPIALENNNSRNAIVAGKAAGEQGGKSTNADEQQSKPHITRSAYSVSAKTIFSATHIKRAIRNHAGAVPNQFLWVPTGKNPPLWPTQRIVRNILRQHGVTKPKILALDLDETLLCALPYAAKTIAKYGKPTYHEAIPTASGAEIYTVWERPHVQLFLSALSRLYTVILFTASVPFYADPFVDRLEGLTPNDYRPQTSMASRIHKPLRIRRRYYRDSCVQLAGPNPPPPPPTPPPAHSVTTPSATPPTQSPSPSAHSTLSGDAAAEAKAQLERMVRAGASPMPASVASSVTSTPQKKGNATTAAPSMVGSSSASSVNGSFNKTASQHQNASNSSSAAKQSPPANTSFPSTTTSSLNGSIASLAVSPPSSSNKGRLGKGNSSGGGSASASGFAATVDSSQRYAKNLLALGVPLDSIVLVDNSPESFALFPDNGILIDSYRPPTLRSSATTSAAAAPPPQSSSASPSPASAASSSSSSSSSSAASAHDDTLLSLIPFLEALYYVPDVRQVLSKRRRDV